MNKSLICGAGAFARGYLSKGYVVLSPQSLSMNHYPGEAAATSVILAVQSIVDRGFVDESHIGLIGFSIEGFVVNSVLTRTNLFRCAIEGAGASDTLSFYGTHSAVIETTQGAHGYSPWEDLEVYLANSAVIKADHVTTPLLILHNDSDERVPFNQGVEMFTALRRNSKEVYLINYTGEGHGVYRYVNKLDWAVRTEQFLDHFLKDAPAPDWMLIGLGN